MKILKNWFVVSLLLCGLFFTGIANAAIIITETATQDLTAGALSSATTYGGRSKLLQVMLTASEAITETVTVVFDSVRGSNYDTVLATEDLSAATSYVLRPCGECILDVGDAIAVTCTNANVTGTVYLTIQSEPLY
ncbi:MAG: hypothetical protein DRP78_06875 [Candidatus Omnitrophota bacterium]|nr:MAG: hypothetical protein DRP78_06875 [Candidatus Omnitrophota bacterium]